MDKGANIKSVETLRVFKVALVDFDEAVRQALGEAKSEVLRSVNWLQNDRAIYWKQQLKYRQNRLADAKSELMRAEIASDTKTSAIVERKMVKKWQLGVDEAQEKLQKIKKWLRVIEHEGNIFKAQCQPLARLVESELPKAYVKLDRLQATLEKYIKMAPPDSRGSGAYTTSSESGPTEVGSSDGSGSSGTDGDVR